MPTPRLPSCLWPVALLTLLTTPPVWAAGEYRSLQAPAVAYDAPSNQGKRVGILLRGTPVEHIVSADKWSKVRDPSGSLVWVERQLLGERRQVIVTASRGEVRERPDVSSRVVFTAERDVLLDMQAPPSDGWLRVRHRDGDSGYIRITQVWGH